MSRKRFRAEQIIGHLREADVKISQGVNVLQICREMGIAEQTYYRWRREYGGMKVDQARRLRDLEKENTRLKQAVAELTVDKLILKEALEGNY
jgi:putative transposase